MSKEILYGIGGLAIGVLIMHYGNRYQENYKPATSPETTVQQDHPEVMDDMHAIHMGSSMNEMMDHMRGSSREDADNAFLDAMIVHHEGAVEMAEFALENAQHEEVRTMAAEIIKAQTREIEQMRSWKKDWGYQ